MEAVKTVKPAKGIYAGLTCGIEQLGDKTMLYPLTECCEASGKGAESPTGVVCRACYEPVAAAFGSCAFLSEGTADWLVRSAAMVNNGGGIPDEGHLYGETDCPEGCEADEADTCCHGYLAAHDTAYVLGWIDEQDNITDKWEA